MALSHLPCNWDDLKTLLLHMLPDIWLPENAMVKHLQMCMSQLVRFHDAAMVRAKFTVNSLGLDHRHYLLWLKSQEEAVLNVQGVIAEVYIPLITNTNIKSLSKVYQSVKIMSSDDDKQFNDTLQLCNNGAMEPTQEVDPEGLLRATIRHGTHVYMEDNTILIQEWSKDAKGKA
ncbi:hypothetical protein ARMGADRAFT_1038595 [Armillaria gallica]|uniref:Uncharacterized protein n=1 Tax=Armillaria gallica TaxID=47427 RepID=A0A2H3CHB7_ARMGA|nr:hypothetical protein ARMGADRAFT_1038595 [Armillaria gallica]